MGGEISVVRYSDCRGAEPVGQAAQGFEEGGWRVGRRYTGYRGLGGPAVQVGGGFPAFHFNGDEFAALGEFGDSRFGVGGGEAEVIPKIGFGGDAQQMPSVFVKAQASVARWRPPFTSRSKRRCPSNPPSYLRICDKSEFDGMPAWDSIVAYPILL